MKLKTSLLILLLLFPISFLKYFLKQVAKINNIIKPLNKMIFRHTEKFLKFNVKQEDIAKHYYLKIWLGQSSLIAIFWLRTVSLSIMRFYYILKSFFKFEKPIKALKINNLHCWALCWIEKKIVVKPKSVRKTKRSPSLFINWQQSFSSSFYFSFSWTPSAPASLNPHVNDLAWWSVFSNYIFER